MNNPVCRTSLVFLVLLSCSLLCYGCAGTGTTAPVKVAQVQVPREVPTGVDAKPIQFKSVVIKLKRGEKMGTRYIGTFCIPSGDLTWQGSQPMVAPEDFTYAFREELQKANYPIVGNPDALFEDPAEWKAELLVAGLVKEINANLCFRNGGFDNFTVAKGGVYLKVNWQIYSRLDRRVVYEVATEGSYQTDQSSSDRGVSIFTNAFAVATQNLLADEGFHKLVMRSPEDATAMVGTPKVSVKRLQPYSGDITKNIDNVRSAVVVVMAGPGHGSGFLISSDGYVLTNEHVVREAKQVKLKLSTGREILGEVVKTDNRRDVALIKAREGQMVALPCRQSEPNVGDEIYALGSPMDPKFNTTLTKGIISNYVMTGGKRYIQSDVKVLPGSSGGPIVDSKGNVVGMTEAGLSTQGVPLGMNFFIPISEALTCMGVDYSN